MLVCSATSLRLCCSNSQQTVAAAATQTRWFTATIKNSIMRRIYTNEEVKLASNIDSRMIGLNLQLFGHATVAEAAANNLKQTARIFIMPKISSIFGMAIILYVRKGYID